MALEAFFNQANIFVAKTACLLKKSHNKVITMDLFNSWDNESRSEPDLSFLSLANSTIAYGSPAHPFDPVITSLKSQAPVSADQGSTANVASGNKICTEQSLVKDPDPLLSRSHQCFDKSKKPSG